MTMDSAAFGDEFLNNPMHQTRWNSFLKKKKALIQVSMTDMMARVREFVRPLLEGTVKAKWNLKKEIYGRYLKKKVPKSMIYGLKL